MTNRRSFLRSAVGATALAAIGEGRLPDAQLRRLLPSGLFRRL
jgi:hypothetical protein